MNLIWIVLIFVLAGCSTPNADRIENFKIRPGMSEDAQDR